MRSRSSKRPSPEAGSRSSRTVRCGRRSWVAHRATSSSSRDVEGASGALVGQRRVDVAVGDDHLPARQGREHHGLDVLGLVGGVQERLRPVGQRTGRGVQDDRAQQPADGGVPGLEGEDDGVALEGQPVGQGARLGGLARALPALEAHEDPGRGVSAAGPVVGVGRRQGGLLSRRTRPGWSGRSVGTTLRGGTDGRHLGASSPQACAEAVPAR